MNNLPLDDPDGQPMTTDDLREAFFALVLEAEAGGSPGIDEDIFGLDPPEARAEPSAEDAPEAAD